MVDRHSATCPVCGNPARLRISLCDFRFAEPLTVYQDLGMGREGHKGYQEIGWNPDSGIHPKPGQPYKSPDMADREVLGGLQEV